MLIYLGHDWLDLFFLRASVFKGLAQSFFTWRHHIIVVITIIDGGAHDDDNDDDDYDN